MEELYKTIKEKFDYKDGFLFWKIKPNSKKSGKRIGSIDTHGRYSMGINKKTYRCHRLIFLYHHGYLPAFIDHIDTDFTNNRIENLRDATRQENCRNRKGANKNSQSGYIGVIKLKNNNWGCVIKPDKNKSQIYLGSFETIEQAALNYNKQAVKHYGEFATLNILRNENKL